MKLAILSDLHLEMRRKTARKFVDDLDPTGVDVCVLAGDICEAEAVPLVLQWFRAKYPEVIYIPGNHEGYGTSVVDMCRLVGDYNCSIREIGGHRFVCATLWFAYQDGQDRWKDSLNDFHLIEGFDPWVYEENKRHEAFLRENVQQGDIVVTHHLPSHRSVHPRYAGLALNQFFVHEMDDLIEERKPALWIHGHSHEPSDYKIGETRVVSCPLGYPNEYPGRHWEPKIVEV